MIEKWIHTWFTAVKKNSLKFAEAVLSHIKELMENNKNNSSEDAEIFNGSHTWLKI
jgi:hypothetical protein